MNSGVRVGLRLLGTVMLVVGIAFAAAFVTAGPTQIAEWAGNSCVHSDPGPTRTAEACNVLDVIGFVPAAGILILVGAVLVFALRPEKVREASRPGLVSRGVARLYARGVQS